jgi:gluconolactonase
MLTVVAAGSTGAGSLRAFGQAPPAAAPQPASQPAPQPAVRDVTVTPIPGVIAAGAAWRLVWAGSDNADGLVGTPDGGLLFAQEQPNRISKLDTGDRVSVFLDDTHGTGSVALDASGRVIVVERTCTDPGRQGPCDEPTAVAVLAPAAERRILANSVGGKPLGRVNDLVVDRRGHVYFTSGGLFHLPPGGAVASVGDGLRTNGVTISPDDKILYVTNGAAVVAFDLSPDGTPARQRDFAKLEAGGSGDGMTVDDAGRLYVTSNPGVQVFDHDSRFLGLIPTPRPVISVAFAGAGRQSLYVVGSGALAANGQEMTTPAGVRNNAKSIFRIATLARGLTTRAK